MDSGTMVFGFVGVLALNYLVPRLEAVRQYPALFWAINGVNVVAALMVIAAGAAAFPIYPSVRFLLALVLLMHLAQNVATRSRWEAEARQDKLEAEYLARIAADEEEG